MAGIGELSVSITARTQKATANIKSFRKTMNSLPAVIGKASTGLVGLGTGLAAIAGVSTIGNEIKKSFDKIDNLGNTSDKLGIAAEKLSALQFAAEENGVAANTTDMALQRMVRRVAEAAQGTGEAVGALDELGLSAARLASMSPDEQFYAVADSMAKVTNQGDRVRLSMKLFDSEGVALVNTLRLGSKGLREYEREAHRLGITVTDFDTKQIREANAAYGRMGKVIEGVSNKIAVGLAPAIEAAAKSTTDWGTQYRVTGDSVLDVLESIARAHALVADGFSFWDRSFKSGQAYTTEASAWLARSVDELDHTLVDMFNKIPFSREAHLSDGTKEWADELTRAAEETRKAADKAWNQQAWQSKIDSTFSKLRKNIEAARKEMEAEGNGGFWELLGDKASETKGKLSGIPQMLADGLSKTESFLSKGANGPFNAMKQDLMGMMEGAAKFFDNGAAAEHKRANPGILNARSAEGYAALRSSMNGGGMQAKLLEAQKNETKQTAKVVAAITDMARKIIPTEIVGFES